MEINLLFIRKEIKIVKLFLNKSREYIILL